MVRLLSILDANGSAQSCQMETTIAQEARKWCVAMSNSDLREKPTSTTGVSPMKALSHLAATALILSLAAPAFAQNGAPAAGSVREACAADIQKICPNAAAGPERRQCMTDNMAKLSDGCKAALAARQQAGGGQGGGSQK
jgi:hypothetical protein